MNISFDEQKELDQRMVELGILDRTIPGNYLIAFDRARNSFTRSIFLQVLEWDFSIADIDPPDPEMVELIESEPLVYKYELEPNLAPELA